MNLYENMSQNNDKQNLEIFPPPWPRNARRWKPSGVHVGEQKIPSNPRVRSGGKPAHEWAKEARVLGTKKSRDRFNRWRRERVLADRIRKKNQIQTIIFSLKPVFLLWWQQFQQITVSIWLKNTLEIQTKFVFLIFIYFYGCRFLFG